MDATIDIYKEIGEYYDFWTGENMLYGFKDLVNEMSSLEPNSNLKLRINSYGGSVLDGLSIYNSIKGHKGSTTAEIVGYAMSISSVIPLACDTVKMASNAWYVIHEARVNDLPGEFESQDLKDLGDVIEQHNQNIAEIYASKMGVSKKDARAMMVGETWLTAKEAKAKGLIDEVIKGVDVMAKVDISDFKNIPDAAIQAINNSKKNTIQMKSENTILAAFGLSEDEITNKDYSKIKNVIARLDDIKNVADRLEEIEDTQSKTVDTLEESIETKVSEVKAELTEAIQTATDLSEDSESALAMELKALKTENAELKEKIKNQDTAIAEGLTNVKTQQNQFVNSMNEKPFGQKVQEQIKLARKTN